jgi:cytochrome c biogenesis protein CcmG/thiol:disulfide interchange protein DsbE
VTGERGPGVVTARRRPPPSRRLRSLPTRTRVIIGAATVGIIVAAGVANGLTKSPVPANALVDEGPAPQFRVTAVASARRSVELVEYEGRPILLNFWGSWCPPCRTELPLLSSAARHDSKVRFIGMDLEDTRSAALATMRRYQIPYVSGFDPQDTVADLYSLRGTPTTIFIDSRGHVVGRYEGALNASRLHWWLTHLK